jgi:hypothetical protein
VKTSDRSICRRALRGAKEVIESKLIPCERCGTVVAMLIFAPNATDAGHFEDYARKMYPHYNHLKVSGRGTVRNESLHLGAEVTGSGSEG